LQTSIFYQIVYSSLQDTIEEIQFRHKEPFVARTKAIAALLQAIHSAPYNVSPHYFHQLWWVEGGAKSKGRLLFSTMALSKRAELIDTHTDALFIPEAWIPSYREEYEFYQKHQLSYYGWEEELKTNFDTETFEGIMILPGSSQLLALVEDMTIRKTSHRAMLL
jgi:hypothetical protein